jgi:hypothetical protein
MDPAPLLEKKKNIHKIMVNWSGTDILAKPLVALFPRIENSVTAQGPDGPTTKTYLNVLTNNGRPMKAYMKEV